MIHLRQTISLVLLLASLTSGADERAAWHHAPSPYRAVHEVTSQPNVPDGGYFVQVPVCGLGDPDGQTVYAFDEKHRELRVCALGPSADQTVLVQVGRDREQVQTIYAYWGSNRKAPQYKMMPPGLTLAVRTFGGKADVSKWDKSSRLLEGSTLAGIVPVATIEHSANPLTIDDAFIMEYRGAFRRDQAGAITLFLVNDDAGYLLIGGKVAIDRSGNHRAHDNVRAQDKTQVQLAAGVTPFQCIVIDAGGEQMAVLAQYVNDRQKSTLPATAYVQPGRTRLAAVETRLPTQVCPAFWSKQLSYTGLDSLIFTEVELGTHTGQPVEWRLGSGGRFKGPKATTIRVGLSPLTVEAAADRRETATGTVHFAAVPERVRWENGAVFRRYAEAMRAEDLDSLDPVTLNGYFTFLDLQQRNPDIVAVGAAILKQRQAKPAADPAAVLLAMARGAARDTPDQAADAYRQLLQLTRDRAVILEVIEFALYRQGDLAQTEELLDRAARILGNRDRQILRYRAEVELLRGNTDETAKALAGLGEEIAGDANFRQNTVLTNATIVRFRDHLKQGYLLEAEGALRELGVLAPDLYSSGHYALLRARLCNRLGWHQAAVAILESTVAYNSLPSFLPDMELERANALRALKREDEARQLLQRIVDTFPNHPAAAVARQSLAP